MNVNSDKHFISSVDIANPETFPVFLKTLEFELFRHIPKLNLKFNSPITVISGTNRSGKSTILMALACSHLDFKKRNPKNGKLERHTWSALMKFTNYDIQEKDWTYYITYKTGEKTIRKRGQRKKETKKWNGIGKKESQFTMRQAVFIDLDRIIPARFYGTTIFNLSKKAILQDISAENVEMIEKYISYILEEKFIIKKIAQHLDKDIYKYHNSYDYSSYNAASGEDVLTRIIIDIVVAPRKSLILIDEVEMGLHPKIQRRLIDVIRNICRSDEKQFVLTTHSSTILDAVDPKSRIFIEKDYKGTFKAIHNVSVNAALSKMDAKSYPLIDLYCEDEKAADIVKKGIRQVEKNNNLVNFKELINIVSSGSADKTYNNFIAHKNTYKQKKIRTGYACVLDGDMKTIKDKKGNLTFPPDENLHFLYSNECPEVFLTKTYLNKHKNVSIEYYLENENPHYLFNAIIENSKFNDKNDVFNYCWELFVETEKGKLYLKSLEEFLLKMARKYSDDL